MKYALSRTKSDTATEITDNTRMHKHTHGAHLIPICRALHDSESSHGAHAGLYHPHSFTYTLYRKKGKVLKINPLVAVTIHLFFIQFTKCKLEQ